jgi:hypothetical protein
MLAVCHSASSLKHDGDDIAAVQIDLKVYKQATQ